MISTPRPPQNSAAASGLTAAQLDTARVALEAARAGLLKALAEHRGGVSRIEAAQAELARLREEDDAQSDETRDFEQLVAARDQEEVQAVDDALKRLEDGSYGLCTSCGEPIAWPRLQAQPEAERCIRCQSAFETEQRRRA